ncbi:hypothetical protein P3W85_28330 [Cupriavidus basilensis]|uniref:Flagellar motor switch protein FliG middle domain-containing protein n=1 Tax=Cupriavidus basilensis TaxID=68895 RepID=A0ABT6AW20_9BURK|nr:hypothetical protein [Cupriavidus basilensis]MDF3836828.1 hypothetical protein [Cupriavidus basilensis]
MNAPGNPSAQLRRVVLSLAELAEEDKRAILEGLPPSDREAVVSLLQEMQTAGADDNAFKAQLEPADLCLAGVFEPDGSKAGCGAAAYPDRIVAALLAPLAPAQRARHLAAFPPARRDAIVRLADCTRVTPMVARALAEEIEAVCDAPVSPITQANAAPQGGSWLRRLLAGARSFARSA